MARSLPLFIAATATQVTTSASVPGATSALSYGDTGVLIHGVSAALASTGGKVTVSVYDGEALATSFLLYQVELDFTSVTKTVDVQSAPIPCFGKPSYTVQSDATGAGKAFTFSLSFQKIGLE
jgi:hypothetical protein|tara:strand:- start:12 stop:380 length:369 start_codon:yes stop_codon:yes gene_type:complete